MADSYVPLWSSIVDSTIWREELHVKVLWITMLAKADAAGNVYASMPGLADAARISIDQCLDGLERLSLPDRWSRTKDHEGRRIEEVDGGWRILNFEKHRLGEIHAARRAQVRAAVKRHRAKTRPPKPITGNQEGLQVSEVIPVTEAVTEAVSESPPPPSAREALSKDVSAPLLEQRMGDLWPSVTRFLERRKVGTWPGWTREMLKLVGTQEFPPLDLAQVCDDDEALVRPIGSPYVLRRFLQTMRSDRNGGKDKQSIRSDQKGLTARAYDVTMRAIKDL